ncbi:acylphosphatase [Oceanospirillum multiglobuliferum]|uniref:acylphosphatase n=1 Tax=Oceanospirillum multiglobuliferum TaxID=64969 RepID=A0A1T4SL44_9GAMM|nr:acylphosphatase [Oceanospirillum multiglobuliferum]OPX54189.1 hypothetical protein BTE48_15445 [Oceanospirillum multiglobuliferum]SKA28922.1 acylphosphatase [Oceanospirillum multiglobuliferum]
MQSIAKIALVKGRVQGVWYRKNTQQQALKLGLTGWAMNRKDGSVEVYAQGSNDAVDSLMQWLWKGSPLSRVDHVSIEQAEPVDITSFEVR